MAVPSAQADDVPLTVDSFTRADGAGWGTAPDGGEYTTTGSADFSIVGGKGVITGLQPGKSAGAFLDDVSTTEALVESVVTVPAGDISELRLHHTVEARRQDDGSAYRGRVLIGPGGALTVSVSRLSGGVDTGLGSVPLSVSAAAGQDLALQMQVTGTDPVTVELRAFPAGEATPAWQQTVTDAAPEKIAAAGGVGVWDYLSGASPEVSVAYDSFASYDLAAEPAIADTEPVVSAALATTSGTVYKSTTFDSMALGAVNPAAFISALGSTNTNASAYNDMSLVNDSRGGKFLRTTLKAGTIHSKPAPGDNGDNLFISLPRSYDSACVEYQIRFDGSFDWSLGGKLPGLLGVAPGTAPSTPTGGGKTEMGWSGRLMWLGPKAYSWAGPSNMAVSYLYNSGQAGYYGDNVRWNKAFVAGKWHTVKQCYSMNTIGQSNGTLKAWMDGQQVLNMSNVKYRTRSDVHITHLSFALFRGGGTLDWAGNRTGYVDVDNMKISSS
ncbi:polysaccharide lyase [Nakamurella deserti]|uniref:polysaccharide lyase n=1 Tax=Nakamurella deserti TaxID=2164074 RepID=UPI0013006C17|nr:hypothetical protein [Nakamurella deserti]